MGQRANLAIVTPEPGYELYYTHWRANSLDGDLFWGPDEALRFARAQRSRSEGAHWLDEVWAEGGAVIDMVRRDPLWFGGEDVRWDVPLRRMHLRLMRAMWPGWTVRWADEGVVDLARRIGLPLATVLVAEKDDTTGPAGYELTAPEQPDWIMGILSLRRASGALGLFALDGLFDDLARVGPPLADALTRSELDEQLDYGARSREFPSGGVHVDEARRHVEVWLGSEAADFDRRLRAAWPGWTVVWRRDRFESQLELCDGRLVFPTRREEALVEHVRRLVTRPSRDHRNVRGNALEHVEPDAKVQINAFALRDDPPPTPTEAHAERFEHAVERALGRRTK